MKSPLFPDGVPVGRTIPTIVVVLQEETSEALIVLENDINEVVGETIAEHTEAVSVEHGVLFIRAESSTWSQELQLKKKEILSKINSKVGKQTIKDLRFI